MSYGNFLGEIKKGLPSNSYILVSSDPFLFSEAVSAIKGLIPPEERDFNLHLFDLSSTGENPVPFENIIDTLNTMPFFTGRKFVIIANFQKILKKDLLKLEQYLTRPSESSVMVLMNSGTSKKDTKDRLKGLKQIILDIKSNEIFSWLQEKADAKKIELPDSAAEYLVGTIGPDLGMLSSEIDKLSLLGKPKVEKKDIIEVIEGKRTYSAFDLVNAIKEKNTEKVLRIYKVLKETEEPYSLLGVLNWQYSQLLSGRNSSQDKQYFHKIFSALNKADVSIKSSGSSYPMELLLVNLLK
jgi:DNA polymerase III subunit delta